MTFYKTVFTHTNHNLVRIKGSGIKGGGGGGFCATPGQDRIKQFLFEIQSFEFLSLKF